MRAALKFANWSPHLLVACLQGIQPTESEQVDHATCTHRLDTKAACLCHVYSDSCPNTPQRPYRPSDSFSTHAQKPAMLSQTPSLFSTPPQKRRYRKRTTEGSHRLFRLFAGISVQSANTYFASPPPPRCPDGHWTPSTMAPRELTLGNQAIWNCKQE